VIATGSSRVTSIVIMSSSALAATGKKVEVEIGCCGRWGGGSFGFLAGDCRSPGILGLFRRPGRSGRLSGLDLAIHDQLFLVQYIYHS
jgi:hypothetical protein